MNAKAVMVIASRNRRASLFELQIERQKATDVAPNANASATKRNNPGAVNQRLATSATLSGVQTHATAKSVIVSSQAALLTSRPKICVAPSVLQTSHAEANRAYQDTIAIPQRTGNKVIVNVCPYGPC